jgi:alkylation response protein AidB-like acyl-CoA dehydrogenase
VFNSLLPLTEEQTEIMSVAREFARNEIAPHSAKWDEESHFERSVIDKLGELGFLGMMLPEELDGLGLDSWTYLLALEEIAMADASIAVAMAVHNSLPSQMLLRWGSDEQKERFLRPMARGTMLGAFALSEPEAGSDAASLRAQAVRDGDDWILTGTKSWVSSGGQADVYLTMARTDTADNRRGARGVTAFILTPDMPGFTVGKKEDKMGLRASPTTQIMLDGVRIQKDRVLGSEGSGFVYAAQELDSGRMGIAAQAIGISRAALDCAKRYASERRQFGAALRDFQAIQFKLADMAMRITAAQTLLRATSEARDRGIAVTQFSSMSKLFASETAMWTATQAIQIFGGYGYMKEYPVEKLFRDAKATEIYEGTSEVQRIVIARELYAHA